MQFESKAEISYDLDNPLERVLLLDHMHRVITALTRHETDSHGSTEPGDQTLGEVSKDSHDQVSASGNTRSAAKYQDWCASGSLMENREGEFRYQYSDECYIDIDFGRSYRVILGNGEYEFTNKTEAERFLWNNFSRSHYDAGEVS